jgi:hypothetical protein
MDVFSTELVIRLSFIKTSEFRGGLITPNTSPPRYATVINEGGKRVTFRWIVRRSSREGVLLLAVPEDVFPAAMLVN